jgi:ATP-dependent exoDNAse (exonuclease V) alpha subunit
MQAAIQGQVLILDEAGMVSGRRMRELHRIAEQQSAGIVFRGDTKQIRSIEAGDALRVLEKESRVKSVFYARGSPLRKPEPCSDWSFSETAREINNLRQPIDFIEDWLDFAYVDV